MSRPCPVVPKSRRGPVTFGPYHHVGTNLVTASAGLAVTCASGIPVYDAQYSVALPGPPKYNPVKFTQCQANGKDLATYKPGGWEGVSKSGKVIGKISGLSGGTGFTVSY